MCFRPVAVIDVDLSQPSELRLDGYAQAQALVRVAGVPVAVSWLSVEDGVLAGEEALSQIRHDHQAMFGTQLILEEPAAMPWPKMDVIICTRMRTESLARALDSILACDYPEFDVYVVDNGPHLPDTRELVEAYKDKVEHRSVHYVGEPTQGLSRARNTGMAHASQDIFAMTDDDVCVDRGWLKAIVSTFEAIPEAACVTGQVLAAELETEAQLIFERKGGFADKGFKRRVHTLGDRPAEYPLYPFTASIFGTGANMAFRRSRLPAGFRFDPMLGTGTLTKGGEDMDIFVDVLYNGGTLVYEPSSIVYHYHRKDMDTLSKTMRGYGSGFGAYLTKQVSIPARRQDLVRCLPAAYRYSRRPESRMSISNDYPPELTRQERIGLLTGPFRYCYGRFRRALSGRS